MTKIYGTWWKRLGALTMASLVLGACNTTPSARAEQGPKISAELETPSADSRPRQAKEDKPAQTRNLTEGYPWFDGTKQDIPRPDTSLEERFPTESGFSRVKLESHSFGAFLRNLPLAAPNTPVLSHRGDIIRAGDHPNVAAVVAIDIGQRDLQQCADAVIRLHAEWRYARGHRDHVYRAASGTKLSFARYAAGDRLRVDGNNLSFVPGARPAEPTHSLLRTWLDDVFGWANTGALARDGQRIKLADLRPGDFFVLTGVPYGHAVLVLDMAMDAQGRRALLLGQSFVPAQNVHVLRPNASSVWFVLNEAEGSIETPFWEPFPFDSLRRLPE
jgi:hypothetical protein